MMLLAHSDLGFCLFGFLCCGFGFFLAFDKQQNTEICKLKYFSFIIYSYLIPMLYLRDVDDVGEIIFNKTKCLL